MRRKSFWKMPITLAVFCLAFALAGCDNPTSNDRPPSVPTPTSVTVTAPAQTVAQNGWWQFTATVGPTGAPQSVIWRIEPSDAGTITASGLLIPTAAPETPITVIATAVGHSNVFHATTVFVAAPIDPTNVTVTPGSAYVGQGGQRQFNATVLPAGAPQQVTWTVEPPTAGIISSDGLLTVTDAQESQNFTVRATAVGHPVAVGTATVTVPISGPIGITVTGIPGRYLNRDYEAQLLLVSPGAADVANAWRWLDSSSVTFEMWDDGHQFTTAGEYEIHLRIWNAGVVAVYHIPFRMINAGSNTIQWSAFTPMPRSTISVTGIPALYHNNWGAIALANPGTMNFVHEGEEIWITGSSASFTIFALPGTYDILVAFGGGGNCHCSMAVYIVPARVVTSTTTSIPFGQLSVLPPRLTITVTNIPSEYRGNGEMELISSATGNWVDIATTCMIDSSATFHFWFADPGIYDIWLLLNGTDRWAEFNVHARSIATTTTIQWSVINADRVDEGEIMSITVTGIPSRYHRDWGDLELFIPGTWDHVETVEVHPVTASTTFRFRHAGAGTYDVVLWLNDFDVRYALPSSRTLSSGMSIPFNHFVLSPGGGQPSPWSFSAPLEHSRRETTGRADRHSLFRSRC